MGQAIRFYETYGWEILGALLLIAVVLLVVQMVRLRKLREQTTQLAKQVRESIIYAPLGRKAADDPFSSFTEEEERQRRQQLTKEIEERRRLQAQDPIAKSIDNINEQGLREQSKEQSQNDLISSVLEEIFP